MINPEITYARNEEDLLDSLLINQNDSGSTDRLLGCAYGQALGDAYGLSTEFETRERIAHNYPDRSKVIPFPSHVVTGHASRWTRGDWTDDTDQWILILETIMEASGDERIFARKLKQWIEHGFRELGDRAGMGLGAHVEQVVYSSRYLDNPREVSKNVWERGNRQAAPNGAVMRCSAVAFVYFNDPQRVIDTTIATCTATHFDPRCIASCLAVCLIIAYLLRSKVNDTDIESLIRNVQNQIVDILGESFPAAHRNEFLWYTDRARTLDDLRLDEPRSIGYTYKCLASGFYGLRSRRPFKETLNDLIRHGGDADTNGAVCGTMYGARYGCRALPNDWLKAMPYKKWFDRKIISCLSQRNLISGVYRNTRL